MPCSQMLFVALLATTPLFPNWYNWGYNIQLIAAAGTAHIELRSQTAFVSVKHSEFRKASKSSLLSVRARLSNLLAKTASHNSRRGQKKSLLHGRMSCDNPEPSQLRDDQVFTDATLELPLSYQNDEDQRTFPEKISTLPLHSGLKVCYCQQRYHRIRKSLIMLSMCPA